ncbi:MAG: hypothetical protein EPO20_26690 [Betaproteobacteria bacterium]|nr:MAG: hypothetical protein EPO20_26690 [Betaproteobacteria bacterium]
MSETSFGEKEIVCNSYIIGKVTVRALHAAQAIFPRLAIMMEISLLDVSDEEPAPIKTPYFMADLTGELRLKETQDVVAPLFWSGAKRFVKSSKRGSEAQVIMACDLDFQRIELVERWREGKPPIFWLQLWPTLIANGERLDHTQISAFQLRVTREAWLDFYSQVGGGKFDVIEVQFSAREAEQFKIAVNQVQKARAQIAGGDYDGAVITCRKAVEAIFRDLPKMENEDALEIETSDSPLRKFFNATTDDKRAANYVGILVKLKGLMNIAAHGIGARVIFSREEAQFILRTTESLLALLGRLASRP